MPAATDCMRFASAAPRGPVHAFALPLLTTTPRSFPRDARRLRCDSSTGAALTRLPVNTAAALAGASHAIRPRSSPAFFLMPPRAPAKRKPGTRYSTPRRLLGRSLRLVAAVALLVLLAAAARTRIVATHLR